MTEVYKALMALGCEWLQLSSYRIKCRWRPNVPRESLRRQIAMPTAGGETPDRAWDGGGGAADMNIDDDGKQCANETLTRCIGTKDAVSVPDLSTKEYCIKIGLTLYKVQQSIYLLDFQKMTGDAFSFMTLCANIITELKTLSAASKQQQALLAQQAVAAVQQQAAIAAAGGRQFHPHK
jgi:5'-AMP-activated protein kinase catalytic alpha subunit